MSFTLVGLCSDTVLYTFCNTSRGSKMLAPVVASNIFLNTSPSLPSSLPLPSAPRGPSPRPSLLLPLSPLSLARGPSSLPPLIENVPASPAPLAPFAPSRPPYPLPWRAPASCLFTLLLRLQWRGPPPRTILTFCGLYGHR